MKPGPVWRSDCVAVPAELDPPWESLLDEVAHVHDDVPWMAVAREVVAAKQLVQGILHDDPDAVRIARLIVDNQLGLLAGQRRDTARLDPEQHLKRRGSRSHAESSAT